MLPSVEPCSVKSFGSRVGRVVRRGQRVFHDRRGRAELVGHPTRRVEDEPLRRRIAVLEVHGHFVRRILGARGHGGHRVEQAAGQAGRAGTAEVALDRGATCGGFDGAGSRLRVSGLERRGEVSGRSGCRGGHRRRYQSYRGYQHGGEQPRQDGAAGETAGHDRVPFDFRRGTHPAHDNVVISARHANGSEAGVPPDDYRHVTALSRVLRVRSRHRREDIDAWRVRVKRHSAP